MSLAVGWRTATILQVDARRLCGSNEDVHGRDSTASRSHPETAARRLHRKSLCIRVFGMLGAGALVAYTLWAMVRACAPWYRPTTYSVARIALIYLCVDAVCLLIGARALYLLCTAHRRTPSDARSTTSRLAAAVAAAIASRRSVPPSRPSSSVCAPTRSMPVQIGSAPETLCTLPKPEPTPLQELPRLLEEGCTSSSSESVPSTLVAAPAAPWPCTSQASRPSTTPSHRRGAHYALERGQEFQLLLTILTLFAGVLLFAAEHIDSELDTHSAAATAFFVCLHITYALRRLPSLPQGSVRHLRRTWLRRLRPLA
ncbi:hypothetical protein THASP1DRAFT_33044 [Thamnocephalis sphaerospora]|uniref:Uncharacterized protein n=1 Tax=Thamnocephalis sphaerospora TaxID=78915 RepID=A0A4P9XHI1_9FUNG|nr:hypothetical protein THASP1DRAFT_33044 [Thamnocephalis sphaerospora]|eukprot:RKP05118.1 hypothetical protein THASP1DRAFT_33044 [Thamnocephalis sphaerospora]